MVIEPAEAQEWLFDLFLRREILSEFETPVLELVALCQSRPEFELIKHTVEQLIVLNSSQVSTQVFGMVDHIKNNISKGKKTAVVAMAWDDKPDSSQMLVQMLKSRFDRSDPIEIFNSVPSLAKKDRIDNFKHFVLVDDFAGTGRTVVTRHNYLTKHAASRKIEIEGHACLLFGMKSALTHLQSESIDTYFGRALQAGISGHFSGKIMSDNIKNMKRLEAELAPNIDGKVLPSMGYSEAEALFFIKDGNAPNSNFPIFWWPEDSKNNQRNTIMKRHEL